MSQAHLHAQPLTPPHDKDLEASGQQDPRQPSFRDFVPDLSTERFERAAKQDARVYAQFFDEHRSPPWLHDLTRTWTELYSQPFRGITSNGKVQSGLYSRQNCGIDSKSIVNAADAALQLLSPSQIAGLTFPMNAREWRAWSNPEVYLRPLGLRLEELSIDANNAILAIIRASFSSEGYSKALAAMRINGFLGEICGLQSVMNVLSYNFLLFGSPSSIEPWGWTLYGHHLCLAVFIWGSQIIISPTFTGAEPNEIDTGPFQGTTVLREEGELGLKLMQSLESVQQSQAQVYKLLHDPAMPCSGNLATDRWNPDDQRHLCGAFRDNRIVPYEGICVSSFHSEQRSLVLELAEHFLLYLPREARRLRLQQIEEHFTETWFSWIGGYENGDAFYYRVQSPVIIFEFDHHSGVFLSNKEPKRFHVHTIVRSPNGGDYGWAVFPRDM